MAMKQKFFLTFFLLGHLGFGICSSDPYLAGKWLLSTHMAMKTSA